MVAAPPEAPPGPPPLPPPRPPVGDTVSGPPPLPPKASDAEAEELVAPVIGTATSAQPEAVVPQEAQKKPPQVRRQPPTRKLQPGELVCGECGEGNNASRKFCARCGTSLANAVVVKTPWWRKLLPRRGPKVRKAGDRPRRSGRAGKSRLGLTVRATFRVLRRVVAIALVLGGVAYGLFAPFRGWVNERAAEAKGAFERTFFPTYAPVSAAETPVASLGLADHPPNDLVDGNWDTYWAAPIGVAEPNVTVKFDRKVHLAYIIVHNGDSADFKNTYRAAKLHLVYSSGKTTDVDLADRPEPQTIELEDGEDTTGLEIHVVATFKSTTTSVLAISEIEFHEEL